MSDQELEAHFLALTNSERVEAVRILTQTIDQSARGITKTPGVMGGAACLAGTRIPVWLMVSYRQQGASDAWILNSYPDLNAADLINIWSYAQAYPEEIAAALQTQAEADRLLDFPNSV